MDTKLKDDEVLTSNISYTEAVDLVHYGLYKEYFNALSDFGDLVNEEGVIWHGYQLGESKFSDRIQLTEWYITTFEELLSENPSDRILKIAKEKMEQFDLEYKYTKQIWKRCLALFNTGEDPEEHITENLILIAFMYGVEHFLLDVSEIQKRLKAGEGKMDRNSFIIEGIENPIVAINKQRINNLSERSFKLLMTQYRNVVNSKTITVEEFITEEQREFSKLFSIFENETGWEYLIKRLGRTSASDMEKLYFMNHDIVISGYEHVLIRNDRGELDRLGLLLSIRKYLAFLREQEAKMGIPASLNPVVTFEAEINWWESKENKSEEISIGNLPNQIADNIRVKRDLKSYIREWGEFEKLCEYFSNSRNINDDDVKIIDVKAGKYTWIGIKDSKIPSLAEFMNCLIHLDKLAEFKKAHLARSIFGFFQINESERNENYFASLLIPYSNRENFEIPTTAKLFKNLESVIASLKKSSSFNR